MGNTHQLTSDPEIDFQSAMADAGVICPDIPAMDGTLHRFTAEGDKNGSNNGWYVLYGDSLPAGAFGNWKTGQSETWCLKSKEAMSTAERQEWQQRMKQASQEREKEQAKRQADARTKAKGVWQAATTDPTNHPYVTSKQISPYGIRQRGETLVIPLRDSENVLHTLQFIDADGNKRFLTGGKVNGCYCATCPRVSVM